MNTYQNQEEQLNQNGSQIECQEVTETRKPKMAVLAGVNINQIKNLI